MFNQSSPAEEAFEQVPDQLPLFVRSLILPIIAGGIGSAATARSVNDWFPKLRQPKWAPPGSLFGPVWTTLYLLMGIADYIVSSEAKGEHHDEARSAYNTQLGLNTLWSVLFFGVRSPGLALLEIPVLLIAIIVTIVRFTRISTLAAALLVPYLLWTTFATALNASIWWKNRGRV